MFRSRASSDSSKRPRSARGSKPAAVAEGQLRSPGRAVKEDSPASLPSDDEAKDEEAIKLLRTLTHDSRIDLRAAGEELAKKEASRHDRDSIKDTTPHYQIRIKGWSRRGAQLLLLFQIEHQDATRELLMSSSYFIVSLRRIELRFPNLPSPEFPELVHRLEETVCGLEDQNDVSIDKSVRCIEKDLTEFLCREDVRSKAHMLVGQLFIQPDNLEFIPRLKILILVVGSRGDVQPFIPLAKKLNEIGHTCRLATHSNFRDFVKGEGLAFYPLGGDPKELLAYMVRNPGLLPRDPREIPKKRQILDEIIQSAWPASTASDLDTGEEFVAEAIIANPVSWAHIHVAERLKIPCHIYFTMPWSPTESFPHPLTHHDRATNEFENWLSYTLVNELTWLGMRDLINNFRKRTLGLDTIHRTEEAPSLLDHLKVPHAYCWSPSLIPKPKDWGPQIDITGFFFLDCVTSYRPPSDLDAFMSKGPPPFYIGFGSVVVDGFDRIMSGIIKAVISTGVRALINKGWSEDLSKLEDVNPDQIFFIGNCPHDWLFPRCEAVCHHGGAGTTAAGLRAGRPTIVVPFFGDQFFWGEMVKRFGAGPAPIAGTRMTQKAFAEAIRHCQRDDTKANAAILAEQMARENGVEEGVAAFHRQLPLDLLQCEVCRQALLQRQDQTIQELRSATHSQIDALSKTPNGSPSPVSLEARSPARLSRSDAVPAAGEPLLAMSTDTASLADTDNKATATASARAVSAPPMRCATEASVGVGVGGGGETPVRATRCLSHQSDPFRSPMGRSSKSKQHFLQTAGLAKVYDHDADMRLCKVCDYVINGPQGYAWRRRRRFPLETPLSQQTKPLIRSKADAPPLPPLLGGQKDTSSKPDAAPTTPTQDTAQPPPTPPPPPPPAAPPAPTDLLSDPLRDPSDRTECSGDGDAAPSAASATVRRRVDMMPPMSVSEPNLPLLETAAAGKDDLTEGEGEGEGSSSSSAEDGLVISVPVPPELAAQRGVSDDGDADEWPHLVRRDVLGTMQRRKGTDDDAILNFRPHTRREYHAIDWTWRRKKGNIRNFHEGVMRGAQTYAECLQQGFEGIVTYPLHGVKSGGFVGGAMGVGVGMLNLIYLPILGTFRLVKDTSKGAYKSLQNYSQEWQERRNGWTMRKNDPGGGTSGTTGAVTQIMENMGMSLAGYGVGGGTETAAASGGGGGGEGDKSVAGGSSSTPESVNASAIGTDASTIAASRTLPPHSFNACDLAEVLNDESAVFTAKDRAGLLITEEVQAQVVQEIMEAYEELLGIKSHIHRVGEFIPSANAVSSSQQQQQQQAANRLSPRMQQRRSPLLTRSARRAGTPPGAITARQRRETSSDGQAYWSPWSPALRRIFPRAGMKAVPLPDAATKNGTDDDRREGDPPAPLSADPAAAPGGGGEACVCGHDGVKGDKDEAAAFSDGRDNVDVLSGFVSTLAQPDANATTIRRVSDTMDFILRRWTKCFAVCGRTGSSSSFIDAAPAPVPQPLPPLPTSPTAHSPSAPPLAVAPPAVVELRQDQQHRPQRHVESCSSMGSVAEERRSVGIPLLSTWIENNSHGHDEGETPGEQGGRDGEASSSRKEGGASYPYRFNGDSKGDGTTKTDDGGE
ncbi:unnamed protein product [Vitrella brassicaformis CCMP3155]|uniref:Uncharacterized protein n=2 Tax=Vitrella brassicaformis TaxID=1169539 RepID=A0A0G4GC85_VITBC|nr:unnamed protein product [Vitrella brassicaformis CCMP3155]|eukprot:CEM26909.1 unnamed protein product [Vitrella brassicaformis CCMP3155]